jgi:uncharacterized membrane protein (UPF0127 family)
VAGRARRAIWVGGLTLITLGAVLHIFESKPPKLTIKIEDITILAEIVDNAAERSRGLSGCNQLPENEGMLFVFSKTDYHRFWMKDMRFPLDIIWINEDKRIVGFERNVPPSFNEDNDVLYIPPVPSKYVLEVNAGFTDRNGISVGETVVF